MKFFTTVTSLILLPLDTLASPVAESAAVAVSEGIQTRDEEPLGAPPASTKDDEGQSKAELMGRDLFSRRTTKCKIINVQRSANCRTGPGTRRYRTIRYARKGVEYTFTCYRSGECFRGNCGWHKLEWQGGHCYVNGYFTDNRCTAAILGRC